MTLISSRPTLDAWINWQAIAELLAQFFFQQQLLHGDQHFIKLLSPAQALGQLQCNYAFSKNFAPMKSRIAFAPNQRSIPQQRYVLQKIFRCAYVLLLLRFLPRRIIRAQHGQLTAPVGRSVTQASAVFICRFGDNTDLNAQLINSAIPHLNQQPHQSFPCADPRLHRHLTWRHCHRPTGGPAAPHSIFSQ